MWSSSICLCWKQLLLLAVKLVTHDALGWDSRPIRHCAFDCMAAVIWKALCNDITRDWRFRTNCSPNHLKMSKYHVKQAIKWMMKHLCCGATRRKGKGNYYRVGQRVSLDLLCHWEGHNLLFYRLELPKRASWDNIAHEMILWHINN